MTTRIIPTIAMLALSWACPGQTYTVDADASRLMWTGSKITGEHTGEVRIKAGEIIMNGRDLGAADITVDMASITCTDLTNESSNAKLVGHLKSDDFFSVVDHPVATFRTTKVEGLPATTGQPNYRVTGNLTIKGITHPASFDVLVRPQGDAVHAAANLTFDRSKYEIRYRSGSFFEDLGDKLIHDEVKLTFDLRAR